MGKSVVNSGGTLSDFLKIADDQNSTDKYRTNAATYGLSQEERNYGNKSPEEMEDEPWYSKAWEWMNSPLYDLHKWGTREGAGTFERGLETGLEDIGSGFLSPLQLGLTIATFGGGAVEEAIVGGLRTIGVSKLAAPVVASTAKALMTAGFSAQMIGGLLTQSPQFLDALKDGDTENATRLGTNIAASGLFLTQGLKHGFEDVNTVKNYVKGKQLTTTDRLALVQELAGNYDLAKSKGTDFARARQEDIVAQLKAAGAFGDDITEAGMRHYITQGGDISRIEKMYGIAEGSIIPRPMTVEELALENDAAEMRKWASESHEVTKTAQGAPSKFYLTDSAEGTHKMGQTLSTEGEPEDAHYVQMKNPWPVSTEDSLKKFIEQAGGEDEAKQFLKDKGYDGIVYDQAKGEPKFITFDNNQYRSVKDFGSIHDRAWSRDHAYIAIDKKNLDKVMNQGIGKDPKRANVVYDATPELALKNATTPDSGDRSDLVVLSVPRPEVEQGVYETNAAVHGQIERGAIGPVEVLPRAKREATTEFEPHIPIPADIRKEGAVTSDREVHAHEMAHSIWASIRGLALGDIHSHNSIDAGPQNFIAAAEIGMERFQHRDGSWAPEKMKPEHVSALLDSFMAGRVADEIVSGIPTEKNKGAWGDWDQANELLKSKGFKSAKEREQILNASLERVRNEMRTYGIDGIIKEEFEKGREKGLSPQLHYSRQRLLDIAERVKDAINEKENEGKRSGEGIVQGKAFREAGARDEKGAAEGVRPETGRPPVADDMLITEKRHMPGHLLEMELTKDKDGNPISRATGRTTPLRPLGAEDLPGNNSRFNDAYTEPEKQKYLAGLKAATRLTDEQKTIANTLRSMYDNSFQKMYEKGLIRDWVEAYHPQAWASEKGGMWKWLFGKENEEVTNGAFNELRHNTNSGQFDTNVNAAKHRAYNTEFQGVMAGEKFKTDDLSKHLFDHLRAVEHAIAARQYITDLRAKDSKAEDGRPAVVLAGSAKRIGGNQNPALAINPERTNKIHIDQEKVAKMMEPNPTTGKNALQEGLENGTIIKLPFTVPDEHGNKVAAYAYSTEGYVAIDHNAMRAWGYIGQDTAGNPALMEGKMLVHPDFEKHVRQVLGVDSSPVRENKILSGINVAAGEAKGMLLSFSPFHIVQEGLRAMLVGINPLKYEHMDINENPNLERGVRNGLVRNNYRAEDNYSTGYASHSKLISKVPGLNRFQSKMQSFLFESYIPGLKDRAYLKLYDDVLRNNPHLTFDEAASRAADMTNDVFGGQNWRKLGVTTAQQDFMRMGLLAPDWLISEIRMGLRAAGVMDKETGAISRRQMAIQVGVMWSACRVLNMLASGQMHPEAPFGVVHKKDDGTETVYSVRTLPTDLLHAASDPEGFIRGRVNPLTVRPTVEFLTGRDALGRRAPGATQVKDLFQNVAPIVSQGIFKGSSLSPIEQAAKGLGGNVARYRTEAEKMADQYASDRIPSGPVDKEHLAAHQKDLELEDAFRKGQISKGQLHNMVAPRRADEIVRRAPMTPLQARFDRLPMSEALNVWAAATKGEKDLLHAQMWKKRQAWLKLHRGPERENESVWRKLQSTYADLK